MVQHSYILLNKLSIRRSTVEAAKPRILVIDDDEDILMTMNILLTERGYIVETAKSGMDAIKKSKEKVFNIALIDVVLPDMHGTQLLLKLKDSVPKTRKIIVTGHATLQNAVDALKFGADSYLMKPVESETLWNVIEEQLRKQEEERKITQEKIVEYIETRAKELAQEKKGIVQDKK